MLDSETKRRIDACRDILVGKVPDPKSQVEQITIALIYKFMDDMDAEAEELGGKRSFFAGDYARFGWAKLMSPSLGGFEVLALYSEAIQKMNENPGVPTLFRDIFKNAYLPYRDPETLKSFLKEINYFTYDHSERLGDAFEYLLSVLGSQGDAGQFRTPRHIIDFMVKVMDPKKNETILDPACGTAGFLISAWKHILKSNTSKKGETSGRAGDLLTPDERARLAASIHGYDISPDMVRLSLVNLYLHGFTDPRIEEYDTLTSDDKWNEVADVILANPPFMSPKGGIKPHKRFTVAATRSEVLFVDYMAEHLTATGRAAIVVPEGIIFQSGTAYKALRKLLVNTSLVAVVSLPAGVFNPYSGVKTSILILDKRLHKQLSSVLFVKVGNDGFNLGAQRRAVVNSDLPEATRLLRGWMTAPEKFEGDGVMAQAVERTRLAENGDFNLSAERYIVIAQSATHAYPQVAISEIAARVSESMNPSDSEGQLTYVGLENIESNSGCLIGDVVSAASDIKSLKSRFEPKDVLYGKLRPNLNKVYLASMSGVCSTDIFVIRAKQSVVPSYLTQLLRSPQFNADVLRGIGGSQLPRVSYDYLSELKIPLPPLEVQNQIVAEIEGYQKIIDGARQVLENYKPHIVVSQDWMHVELGTLCDIEHGFAFKGEFFVEEETPDLPILLTPGNFVQGGGLYFRAKNTKRYSGDIPETFRLKRGDLIVVMTDLSPMMKILGMPALVDADNFLHNQRIGKVVLKTDQVLKSYLRYALLIDEVNGKIKREATGATVRHTSPIRILSVQIPLPDLPTQRAIVAEIEAEQALVNANRELIRRMEAKVKAAIDRVWSVAT